jgi:hypothetical protein
LNEINFSRWARVSVESRLSSISKAIDAMVMFMGKKYYLYHCKTTLKIANTILNIIQEE